MRLWTAQTSEVWALLNRDGRTVVKKQFIREKYGEAAWSFLIAYDFMARKLAQKILPPEGAESPVWLYADPQWAGENAQPLEVPESEIVLFDLRKWYRVLSLSYVGTQQEEAAFDVMLKRQGIRDSLDVFYTSFYPLQKRQIMASWERIFDLPEDTQYHQAACWQLNREWKVK